VNLFVEQPFQAVVPAKNEQFRRPENAAFFTASERKVTLKGRTMLMRISPSSPTRLKNIVFSEVSTQWFPLHFALEYFGRQSESEFFEEDLLVIGGC